MCVVFIGVVRWLQAGSTLGPERAHDGAACYPNIVSPFYYESQVSLYNNSVFVFVFHVRGREQAKLDENPRAVRMPNPECHQNEASTMVDKRNMHVTTALVLFVAEGIPWPPTLE